MAITQLPSDLMLETALTCALCHVELSFSRATVGLPNASNHQTFACISHLFEVEKLINGWADFMAQERMERLLQGQEPVELLYGGPASA